MATTNATNGVTNKLKTASGTVSVSAATAPTSGQVLTATSSTAATWQTPSSGITWAVKTANYTAVAGDGILADTSGGAWTLTLPASATLGDTIRLADVASSFGTNNLTVARNGLKIQGLSADMTFSTNDSRTTFTYSGATYGWILT